MPEPLLAAIHLCNHETSRYAGHNDSSTDAGYGPRLIRMQWTERQTDLFVTGVVGFLGALIGSIMAGFSSRVWGWWDRRRSLSRTVRHYRFSIVNLDAPNALSHDLLMLKQYLLSNEQLLEKPAIEHFFDTWLRDTMLDAQAGHSRLCSLNPSKPGIDEVKRQIDELKRDVSALVWP